MKLSRAEAVTAHGPAPGDLPALPAETGRGDVQPAVFPHLPPRARPHRAGVAGTGDPSPPRQPPRTPRWASFRPRRTATIPVAQRGGRVGDNDWSPVPEKK